MGTVQDLMQVGFSPIQAKHLGYDFAGSLTAAGNASQANAYAIAHNSNHFTTVGATTNSSRLPNIVGSAYSIYFVRNDGANGLNVFPAVGESINALAVNNSYPVLAGTGAMFVKVSDTQWIAF